MEVFFRCDRCDVTWKGEPWDDVCWNCDERGRRPSVEAEKPKDGRAA